MALQADTFEILVEKAKFEPKVALAVGEAIQYEMTQAQFVTVPVLDARVHELRAEIRVLGEQTDAKLVAMEARLDAKLAALEAKLVRWVFLVMLGNVALSMAANSLMSAFKTL